MQCNAIHLNQPNPTQLNSTQLNLLTHSSTYSDDVYKIDISRKMTDNNTIALIMLLLLLLLLLITPSAFDIDVDVDVASPQPPKFPATRACFFNSCKPRHYFFIFSVFNSSFCLLLTAQLRRRLSLWYWLTGFGLLVAASYASLCIAWGAAIGVSLRNITTKIRLYYAGTS